MYFEFYRKRKFNRPILYALDHTKMLLVLYEKALSSLYDTNKKVISIKLIIFLLVLCGIIYGSFHNNNFFVNTVNNYLVIIISN